MHSDQIRQSMAGTVQRGLNSLWESKIIDHLRTKEEDGENIDYKFLNTLVSSYIKLELAYDEILSEFSLKIAPDHILTKSKYAGLPRRFKVVMTEDNSEGESVHQKIKLYYNKNMEEHSTFALVFNAYANVLELNKYVNYVKDGEHLMLRVDGFYKTKEGKSVAILYNGVTSKSDTLYLDNNMETLKSLLK